MRSKFSRVNHFIASARSLRIKPPYPHQYRVLRARKTSSEKFKYGDSIILRLIVPPSKEPRVLQCQTTEELIELVKTYRGTLTEFSGNGFSKIIPHSKYFEVSPHTIYEIISPYFTSMTDERQHRQIADKGFADKSRRALTRYLEEQGFSFRELDRVVKADGKPIAGMGGCVRVGGWKDLVLGVQTLRLDRILSYYPLSNSNAGHNPTSVVSFEKEYESDWKTREQW
jgi:hypothetical protein